jgi:peptide chain release factor 1
MQILLEIRPGEGGDDAKLLVYDQAKIYQKYCSLHGCLVELASSNPFELNIQGPDQYVRRLLKEAGGHRWQRNPPTENHGRVHTSTVTVAVFELKPEKSWVLRDADIDVMTTKDSGPGGQHRNKVESCVIMRHIPTGLQAKASSKHQHKNRRDARLMLEAKVATYYNDLVKVKQDSDRKSQVGSGMRGDKIRTYRCQDNIVTDHVTGNKVRLTEIMAGKLDLLG